MESSVMAHRRVDAPQRVAQMKVVLESTPPPPPPEGGEAQTVEVVSDELNVPKANEFTEGESTARHMFTVGSDGDRR
jgi:hypothetical protein